MNSDLILVLGIMGGVCFILNIVFLLIIFSMRRRTAAISEWPSTSGTVTVSTLRLRRSSNNRGRVHYPVVHYTYRVMGQAYQGDTITPGLEVGGSGAAGVIARYPVGLQVTVHYHPDRPSEAVLEKNAPAMFWMWFILIVIDLMLCGGTALFAGTLFL